MKPLLFEVIYYGSRVVLFFLLLHWRQALRGGRVVRFLVVTVLLTTFVRVRWIEPQQIAIKHTSLDLGIGKRVALIADLHLGVYKDRTYLQRVVDTINAQTGVDMLLIAGDLTFRPDRDLASLRTQFRPFRDLHVPVYMVLGNHDVEKPGPKLRDELVQALESYGIQFLQNDIVDFGSRKLVGLGDHDGGEDNVFLLNQLHSADTVVVLTHNPDTTLAYANYNVDLTLVGHTHCGQIRIPRLHRLIAPYLIPTRGDFDCGVVQTKYSPVLITPGVGEVGLPMRWFNPPTIDIIDL